MIRLKVSFMFFEFLRDLCGNSYPQIMTKLNVQIERVGILFDQNSDVVLLFLQCFDMVIRTF